MKQKKKRGKLIFPLLLLGLVCVCAVELAVCRVADPALYTRITAPARALWADTRAVAAQLTDSLFQGPDGDEVVDNQLAGDPALTVDLPPEDPAVTALETHNGIQVLTGGAVEVVYYQQSAPQWADKPYGQDTIGPYGCGPTAMAMAISSMTALSVNPEEMGIWSVEHGYWASRSGSHHGLVGAAAVAYGLTVEPLESHTPSDLMRELSSGKLLVALMTKGHFTQNGHFILLRGATLDGKILVADPNSLERSLTAWEPQLILDELSSSRNAGAPLWLLSPPLA